MIARREPAHDAVTAIINLGPPIRVAGPSQPMRDLSSFVAPMNGSYGITDSGCRSLGIQLDLHPAFAHRLLGVPMHELDSVAVPLEDLMGSWAVEIRERLLEAGSWERRFDLLESELLALADPGPRCSPDVGFAWNALQRSDGRRSVESLAAEIGCSRRHLGKRFQEQIGLSPKRTARLIRFSRTIERLGHGGGDQLAEVAVAGGYFDQPHMNREFLEFAGTTPARFLASALSDASGFGVEPKFPFVQDSSARVT